MLKGNIGITPYDIGIEKDFLTPFSQELKPAGDKLGFHRTK